MNTNILKRIGIILGGTIATIYILFLILPFIVTPIANNYLPMVNEEVQKATGLSVELKDFRVVTTPKFTVGAKLGKFSLLTPDKKEILSADNFQVKMSLLPLLARKIEVDIVKLDNLNANLDLNKDGSFVIEKYLPVQEESQENETQEEFQPMTLPFGIKLSNHLPDIKLGTYRVSLNDISTGKSYILKGNKTEITDFVLDKHVRILADGSFTLDGREQFKYDVKVNNKIMPELELNELVFNPQEVNEEKKENVDVNINILDILKGLYNYNITANANADLTLTNEGQNGFVKLENISVAPSGVQLPASNAELKFKGNKIDIDSNLYTAKEESTTISGIVNTGKKTNIDLNIKSGAELANIVKILNAFAMTFNIKDLQTLTANGKLDINCNIKSDLKTVNSNGYLKIPSAKIRYGLYDITIDKINADIALDNNNINIKNVGFSIFEQPLRFYGLVKQDASADLHLIAENLSLKGLMIACGQAALLKENNVNSGLVTLRADIVGKLESIKPTAKVVLSNLDIKNIPSNTILRLPSTNIDVISDGKTFSGTTVAQNIKVINPAAAVSVPKLSANINPDIIEIAQTPVTVEKINFNVSGRIKDYMTEKIALDFSTTGDIKSKLSGDMNMVKQTLNLVYATTENSTIIIPMFDKSKMVFNGNIVITGSMMNPMLSGGVNVISLNMPEIPMTIDNLSAKLNGAIINGNATVKKFTSGGIAAENIVSDFSMKGDNFYLTNLKGDAFCGKINGNIIYNLVNAKTTIDFKGEGMDAVKAIEGAAGIKNALTGTLGFDTKLKITVLPDYNAMMKTLGGNLSFRVDKGNFGNIGRLEHFLGANNIMTNVIMKTTVESITKLAGIKNTAEFDYITGNMSFSNGWADIKEIKSTGKTLAYFVSGKYNLVNGTTNVKILGRLDGGVVKLLGPIGELSAEKLLSFIPKFGAATANIASSMTADPDKEKTSSIPKLSNNDGAYKDFKVDFNGGIESKSSVKSFKWLTKLDTSALSQVSVVDTVKSLKTNVNTDINTTVNSVKNTINVVKEQKDLIKNTAGDLKNLLKF